MSLEQLAEEIRRILVIYEIQQHKDDFIFVVSGGMEKYDIHRALWKKFDENGYDIFVISREGAYVIVAKKQRPERVWLNVLLFAATVLTTTMAGAELFGVDYISNPHLLYKGLPFSAAIMAVLGTHELGHYFVAKKNGMRTSFPFFIPIPTGPLGTFGAVIKHRGPIPDRKALFDVGIAGPLAGLVVAVVVTFIGLSLQPVMIPSQPQMIEMRYGILPPMFSFFVDIVSAIKGVAIDPNNYPIAFAGWVGMFVTFLNLLPAGQLDGGHIVRSIFGKYHEYVSQAVPVILMVIGSYYIYFMQMDGSIWIFWGLLTLFLATSGHPPPLDDKTKLDGNRIFLGVLTFILGVLCFTPVPFTVMGGS
jgi:membrane-associated protease RseP (regulator of RpoE activity)